MEAIGRDCENGRLRLRWDHRRLRQDRVLGWLLLGAWCLWAPATLYATYAALTGQNTERWFYVVWSIGGWLGTLLLPYLLAQRSWREWVELDARTLAWGAKGWLAPADRRLPLEQVEKLVLAASPGDESSGPTRWLRIHTCGAAGRRQYFLGYWLNQDLKQRVFDQLAEFVRREGIPLRLEQSE